MAFNVVGHAENGKISNSLVTPAVEELGKAEKAQHKFGEKLIKDAISAGVLDEGRYHISFTGHALDDNDNERKSFSFSASPMGQLPVDEAEAEAQATE